GGALDAWLHQRAQPVVVESRTARYEGTVLDRERAADLTPGTTLVVALDAGLRVLARVHDPAPPIGARVVLRGRLTPFDDARNPGEPSQRAMERERGLDAQLQSATVLKIASARDDGVAASILLARAHQWAHAQLRDRLGEPDASVVAGELWGERSALPPDLRTEFQETGTVHVLVTAGLHLGAVAALCLALLSLGSLPRWLTCALVVAAVWLFVLWSGAQLPAVRAAAMATAALAARACGRASFSWNALAIAALAIALMRPESIATASFALSFSCVAAIFALAPLLERWIDSRFALPARVREALVLSLATQLGTWPLTAAIFLQFAPYATLANLAVVPCVAATMALGALQLAAWWCDPLAQALANVNSWLLAWTLAVVRTLASLPQSTIVMTPAPAWCIAMYDTALIGLPILWQRGARTLAVAALAVACSYVLWPPHLYRGELRITALDVGQADAIVVQTPRGHTLLVDSGGRLERGTQSSGSVAERVGERIVVPFLLRHGIHAIDALIVSHPHGDHVGGAPVVLRKLHVAEFADSDQQYGGHAYRDALATARSQHVPMLYPRAGMQWETDDGVVLQFLGPSLPFITNSRNDINENSIAFTLRYRSFCMLFTGDAGAAAEQRFLSEGVDLRCDVLKVGHHGSAYSSTPAFIAAVNPRYAIISVGRHNLFGHPAPATIETLRRFGATIYRTDENGAVSVTADGSSIAIRSVLRPGLAAW
ncbi:MAG TPA: DNA internalization-related competence protein ComEC/Rec2, partial [Candidatus Baltobacteraceae bacterium]|nr:DNA internalization-related competence protein ComEC/Rec2 [Candidatus Baltobacteraceae bacterium]